MAGEDIEPNIDGKEDNIILPDEWIMKKENTKQEEFDKFWEGRYRMKQNNQSKNFHELKLKEITSKKRSRKCSDHLILFLFCSNLLHLVLKTCLSDLKWNRS